MATSSARWLVEIAVFEQQVPRVHDRRHAGGVRAQGLVQGRSGRRPIAARECHEGSLLCASARSGSFARRPGFVEAALRFVEFATAQARAPRSSGPPAQPGDSEQPREERHRSHVARRLISLFPEMFAPVVGLSIVGRAVERADRGSCPRPARRTRAGRARRRTPLRRRPRDVFAHRAASAHAGRDPRHGTGRRTPPYHPHRAAGRPFAQTDAEAFAGLDGCPDLRPL